MLGNPTGFMNSNLSEQDHSVGPVNSLATVQPLRRYVSRHNRQALLLAFFSLVAAVILWGALYVFVFWFVLFTATVIKGFNPDTLNQVNDPRLVSAWFPAWFALGAVVYLGLAALCRRHLRMERIREARHYLVWVLLELFMSVPNVTFSIWGNLQAITRLRKHEAVEAWRLLQRMNQEDGRLSLTSLRLEIDDESILCRVMFTLQIVGLVGMRENSEGWFLYLQGQDVRTLLSRAVV